MKPLKAQVVCRVSRSVGLYADDELEPSRAIEVEMHLAVCESCREELDLLRAMRKSLRRSTTRTLPQGFAERMRAAVVRETETLEAAQHASTPMQPVEAVEVVPSLLPIDGAPIVGEGASTDLTSPRARRSLLRQGMARYGRFRMSWGTAMAMAAAASFVVAFFASRAQRDGVARLPILKSSSLLNPVTVDPLTSASADLNDSVLNSDVLNNTGTFDQLIDRLVTLHAHPVPPETSNFDDAVNRFSGTLGVGLDKRQLRKPFGANFNGARMHVIEFRDPDIEPTAELRYTMQGHRLTIYVFDPRRVPMRVTRLTPHMVQRQSPVYVGRVRGFSVAAVENGGVGYAMASDLDDEKSVQLVAQIR